MCSDARSANQKRFARSGRGKRNLAQYLPREERDCCLARFLRADLIGLWPSGLESASWAAAMVIYLLKLDVREVTALLRGRARRFTRAGTQAGLFIGTR